MDVPVAVGISVLLWKLVDFVRYLANYAASKSALVTQVAAWVAGVITVELAAHASLFNGFTVNGTPIGKLDGTSLVFLGLLFASFGSALTDVKRALDSGDSAAVPSLLKRGDK